MKLKIQIEKQKAYAIHKRDEAKKNGNLSAEWYWSGIIDAMMWVPSSREDWKYVDSEVMPVEEKMDFV